MVIEHFGINVKDKKYDQQTVYTLGLLYNSIHSELTSLLKSYNLTLGKFNILVVLNNLGEAQGLPQVEVSQRLIVTASNMTKMVDKLEKDGLVKRFSLPGDRRVNMVQLTKEGSKLVDQVWPGFEKKISFLGKGLKAEESKQLAELMIKWFASLNN